MSDELDYEQTSTILRDSLAAWLLSKCYESNSKEKCDDLTTKYSRCEICLDDVLKMVFPFLQPDEQKKVEKIATSGIPSCSNNGCPIK